MLRCSRPYRFHRTQRKKPKRTDLELPEVNRPGRVHRITKRPCLRRTAIARFRRRLRSRRIPLLRLNLWRLCQARVQAPILRALPEHRLPPKNPPYRRLESLTRDNPLPRDLRLPWVSRRAGKAVLSPGRSHHCGAEDRKSTRLELQSHVNLVCRLLLEKKKKKKQKGPENKKNKIKYIAHKKNKII